MGKTIEFKRGDRIEHYFDIAADDYVSTDTLQFIAKPAVDDDGTNSKAVITGTFTSADVSDITKTKRGVDTAYKRYTCVFPGSATTGIIFNGQTELSYLGEFQLVPVSGDPTSFPGNDDFFDVVVYPDLKIGS